jgi:hypothetical protein
MCNSQTFMKKQILLLLFLPIFNSEKLDAQSTQIKDNIILPGKLIKFIPKGYALLDSAVGDLNLDKIQDVILILKNKKENNAKADSEYKRPLLILLGHVDKTYTLSKRNDNVVYTFQGGGIFGDPFSGVKIKNGYFSIDQGIQGGQHWQQLTTFRFDQSKGNWFLYKDHLISYNLNESNDPNAEALVLGVDKLKTAKDFGIISIDKFNINNDNMH